MFAEGEYYITYTGTLPPSESYPSVWGVLQELNVGLRLTGRIDITVIEKDLKELKVHLDGYVSHSECVKIMKSAYSLLLLIPRDSADPDRNPGPGIIPGKIFEYLAARRPIIGIGDPKGESSSILRSTGGGIMIHPNDKERLKEFILSHKNWMYD